MTYTVSTILHDTLKSIGGCDSIYKITNITITPITPTIKKDSLSGCNSVSYNSITYTASTTLRDTLKSIGGCDSIYKITNIQSRQLLRLHKKIVLAVATVSRTILLYTRLQQHYAIR